MRPVTARLVCAFIMSFAGGAANPGPLIIEETARLVPPGGGNVDEAGVSGNTAIISSTLYDEETNDATWSLNLFQRSSAGLWQHARTLAQRSLGSLNIPSGVAMSGNVAAVSLDRVMVFEKSASGWSEVAVSQTQWPIADLETDGTTILATLANCAWSAQPLRRNASGLWGTFGFLQGSSAGCNPVYSLEDGDISGNRAIVLNDVSDVDGRPEVRIYEVGSALPWVHRATLTNPQSPDKPFGPSVALQGDTALVLGSDFDGVYVFDRDASGLWQHTGNISMPEWGSGADRLRLRGNFAFASYYSVDLQSGVIAVHQRQANGQFKYVARLVARQRFPTDSLSAHIDVSGQRIVVSGNGPAYVFDLPTTFTQPAPVSEDFESGSTSAWSTNPGSGFAVATTSTGRVYRQSSVLGDAIAVRSGVDWKNQAIEADITPMAFSGSNRWVGLVARYTDANNYYYVALRQSNVIELKRKQNGVFATLASEPLTVALNRTYRVRLQATGASIKVYVDGRFVTRFDDIAWDAGEGPVLPHGGVGVAMYKTKADIDNIYVTPDHFDRYFEMSDARFYVNAWTQELGYWSASGEQFVQSTVTGDARALVGNVGKDQIVQTRVRPLQFAAASGSRWFGVIARYKDAGNFYYVTLRNSNEVSLRKLVNGQSFTLATAPLSVALNQWYDVRLAAVGTSLRVWINGKQVLAATDSSHTAGRFGLATYKTAASYDDVVAYDP